MTMFSLFDSPHTSIVFFQAFSSGYMPIGAVLMSPEIAEVILSYSDKLGKLMNDFSSFAPNYIVLLK